MWRLRRLDPWRDRTDRPGPPVCPLRADVGCRGALCIGHSSACSSVRCDRCNRCDDRRSGRVGGAVGSGGHVGTKRICTLLERRCKIRYHSDRSDGSIITSYAERIHILCWSFVITLWEGRQLHIVPIRDIRYVSVLAHGQPVDKICYVDYRFDIKL